MRVSGRHLHSDAVAGRAHRSHTHMTSQNRKPRVAIIDSDSGFLRVLTRRLQAGGAEYRVFSTPPLAEELLTMRMDAVVIDLTLLGPQGWEFVERLGKAAPDIGIVVCSQGTLAQRVRALREFVDDWISKPCHPEEVAARVEAVNRRRRRSRPATDSAPVRAGELEVRADQFQAFVAGEGIGLTRREFELLQTLVEASGRVIEREDVYQSVWGYTMAHGDRSVDVFVRKLRAKLEQASPEWNYIHTHFGVGYRFEAEPRTEEAAAAELERRAGESEASEHDDDLEHDEFAFEISRL
ncbi:response regulator transcription factor [Thermoleophilia bacterium SCSIO 60948]|nr:response regulator transcription factor [Thermoleophilia bacterium SCSIO 60948]